MPESKRVYVHIGAPKTGTTYLQRILAANRKQLGLDGVLYPAVGREAHHTAAWGLRPESGNDVDAARFLGHWTDLVNAVKAWDGHTVIISSEMFVFFNAVRAEQVVTAFGDADVHVLYTARDLVRQVPAVWQEQVKNQMTQGYRSFVRDLLGPRRTQMAKHFWRAQDAPKALSRWSSSLDAAHVHVVTAPPSGSEPTLLWRRFAAAVGLDADRYDAELPVANTSLSVAGAEVLRRYNARHAGSIPSGRYRRLVRRPLMPALLEGVSDRTRLPLGALERRLLARRSARIVAGIQEAGYDVVGSLDDLTPPLPGRGSLRRHAKRPDELSDDQVIDALLDVVHDMLETQRKLTRRAAVARRGRKRTRPRR